MQSLFSRLLASAARLLAFATLCAAAVCAQPLASSVSVPRLVRFSGSFHSANGSPSAALNGSPPAMAGVTVAIYREQTGGSPLWQEVQNVPVDSAGNYSLLLGATLNDGLPMDLFSSNEPRWLGVQFNRPGEIEQPRVLLASVPYALKSVDAETLGGKPASAYALAESTVSSSSAPSAPGSAGVIGSASSTSGSTSPSASALKPRVTGGTPGFLGVFVNSTDLGNSVVQQANGAVGVGTVPGANAPTTPSLDLRTSPFSQIGMAQTTDYLTFFSSDTFGPAIYWNPGKDMRFGKGGASLYNAFGFTEQMRIQSSTGNLGIGTQTPGSKLDVAGDINLTGRIFMNSQLFIQSNVTNRNVSVGNLALPPNTTGFNNTAVGNGALLQNSSGLSNTALGASALQGNTAGSDNTGVGNGALLGNLTGMQNTAIGSDAMVDASGGNDNVAVGFVALDNSTGSDNVAVGARTLQSATTAASNTAVGYMALANTLTGSGNTALGLGALQNTTGADNIGIGSGGGVNIAGGNSNIMIGNIGQSGDEEVIRIGSGQATFFAAGIRGVQTGMNNAVPVVIDSAGQLGTVNSSRRFKEDIEDMADSSRGLMQLRPVTFRYKQPYADGSKPIQYGLIAEEVAEVYPDLVARSADGQIESVKYQVLDSMLLNELQRQQAEIAAQKSEIASQKELIQKLLERVSKLESARIESPDR